MIRIIIEIDKGRQKERIRFGFKSKNQLPWFMIWKEYINEYNEIDFAKILFKI